MGLIYVHTLGDSTLDNLYWMLNNRGSNADEAKQASVEGQLQKELNPEGRQHYEVVSHAYDGFTTRSVLKGDNVGRVLGIYPRYMTEKKRAYLADRKIDSSSESYFVQPLKNLKTFISENSKATHYVVISVGGNDFRERLSNPIAMLKEIPQIHKRYFEILQEVKNLNLDSRDVKPILMFQYRLDAHHDHYMIYTIMKVIGISFAAIQSLSMFGMAASVFALTAKKVSRRFGFMSFLFSATCLGLSHRVMPLRVTKGILSGQNIGITTLGGLMEVFYRPIVAQAKKDKIPILDLPNTFNPDDSDLYLSQIEPSEKGGRLITEGIKHIIQNHAYDAERTVIYSKRALDDTFSGSENRGPGYWRVAYPSQQQ